MWGAMSPRLGIYLLTGFRITPNADVIGGHAGFNRRGVTRTLRFSREWRREIDTAVGPFQLQFTRPMEEMHLVLGKNPSGMEWDLRWLAEAPAHLSSHHLATNRGRRTTDQSRYNQVGRVEGWAEIDGRRITLDAADWLGIRDHSWGIYEGRPPLGGHTRWLPPAEIPAARRALRFSFFFATDEFSGYFHLHEDEEGRQIVMNRQLAFPRLYRDLPKTGVADEALILRRGHRCARAPQSARRRGRSCRAARPFAPAPAHKYWCCRSSELSTRGW